MSFRVFTKIGFLLVVLFFTSCASKKNVVYLQNIDTIGNSNATVNYETRLQNDDLLSIIVSADQPEATLPFNMPQIQGNYQINENQDGIKTYLIDAEGNIDFPVVGKVKLGGLTRAEAINKLTSMIKEYITNPQINLRILNYKISVLGEVVRPGSFKITGERITLLEAISMAGDLTIYGNRGNILVIREVNGTKTYTRIDVTKADFMNSSFYYLTQNDIVVVEPNQTKVNSSVIGPDVATALTALTLLTTVLLLFIK
ncbi:polysaccharide biosynthesis/export family protein [Flavobacterium sp. RSB2_4_14]|uniref:polysaccharide biosynthesis/export family protein n=1 Tax=Flavobacterium sp. RSB2_4_14 TaxID=3447665 RepID=UPI003F389B20